MLNRAERFKVLKFIANCCNLGYLPAVVNLSTWQLVQHSTAQRRRWPNLTCFGLFVVHCLYKIAMLIRVYFTQKNTPRHQLIIHALVALGPPIIIHWYYLLFIRNPGAFSCFFQLTLTGNIGGKMAESKIKTKFVNRLKEYTLQDLVALTLPYTVAIIFLVILTTYIYSPDLQLLLYAGLPAQFQTWLSFTVLLLEECRYFLMEYAVALPVWTLQVISFDLVNNHLKRLIGSIRRTGNRRRLERTYGSLRHIQLYISIINEVNRNIIFSTKILCLGISICSGYAAVAHFSDYPVFGVMYYLMVLDASFLYTVSNDKAFKIPRSFKAASEDAVLGLLAGGGYGGVRILKRQMRSIPPVGIMVGEFHVLERESTPAFVNYVVNNIVTMLVAFRR